MKIAKLVMTGTNHVMLVGGGAAKFAREMGFKQEDLLVKDSRAAWLVWKRSTRDKAGHTNWSGKLDAGTATARLQEAFANVVSMRQPEDVAEKSALSENLTKRPIGGLFRTSTLLALSVVRSDPHGTVAVHAT